MNRNREKCGEFQDVVLELRKFPERFYDYFRMSIHQFDELLQQLLPLIRRQCTNYRRPISLAECLAVCLQ